MPTPFMPYLAKNAPIPVHHRIPHSSSRISTELVHPSQSLSQLYKATTLDSLPNALQDKPFMGDRTLYTNS